MNAVPLDLRGVYEILIQRIHNNLDVEVPTSRSGSTYTLVVMFHGRQLDMAVRNHLIGADNVVDAKSHEDTEAQVPTSSGPHQEQFGFTGSTSESTTHLRPRQRSLTTSSTTSSAIS